MKSFLYKGVQAAVLSVLVFCAFQASAHVTVSPSLASGGSYQSFTLGVPSERDATTVNVRLVIPAGLDDVMPNVKPGWNISFKKSGDVITEIIWSGGKIPTGLRDQFLFTVKTPQSATLIWKAYQTYDDGTVVSWDAVPQATHSSQGSFDHETATSGPYSQTFLTPSSNDGHGGMVMDASGMSDSHGSQHIMLFLTLLALGISLGCVYQITKIEEKLKK